MNRRDLHFFSAVQRSVRLAGVAFFAFSGAVLGQTWTPLAQNPQLNGADAQIQMLLLLSDGTVMAQQGPSGSTTRNVWFRLTPNNGSYVNGTWTQLASMNQQRLFYSSVVLQNGKVFVAGGEYGSNGTRALPQYLASAELFDPVTNIWTNLPAVPNAWTNGAGSPFAFGDSACTLLPNGNVLIGPVFPNGVSNSAIYNLVGNSWIDGPPSFNNANQNEATWLKLPDNSILTVPQNSTASQRYIPSLLANGQWIADGTLQQPLYSAVGSEIGSAQLLANGDAFFIGANGNTALYTPTGNNNNGSWRPGPALPNVTQYVIDNNGNVSSSSTVPGAAPDGPSAMLPNGRILCALTGTLYNDPRAGTNISTYWKNKTNPQYPTPVSFFEYDPVANTFASVPAPMGFATDAIADFQAIMLVLPDGSVLYSNNGSRLYVYTSTGPPLAAGKPAITGITTNPDGSYHLTGTGLNGISFGASYGEDAQMDTNYPIVRLVGPNEAPPFARATTYARTFNWSSTGVRTGNTTVSTEFVVPASITQGNGGTYSLVVVANGISSDPVDFTGPVWVDFNYPGATQDGTFDFPYPTLDQGVAAVAAGGTIALKGPSSSSVIPTPISKPMTIISVGGPTKIGP